VLGQLTLETPANAQLSIEWDKTYGGSGWEELQTMILTDDGGYLFAGVTTSDFIFEEIWQPGRGSGDFWIVKTDSLGNPHKTMRYGGSGMDRIWSVKQTADGGFILSGESASGAEGDRTLPNRGGLDFWMVKVDAGLLIEWQRVYGSFGDDVLRTVLFLPDGGYLLAGYSNSDAGFEKKQNARGQEDYWAIKTDAYGNVDWEKTYGGDGQDWLFDAEIAPDGNFILGGFSTSAVGFEKQAPLYGMNDFWVLKVSATDGSILWQKTLGGPGEEALQDLYVTQDGGYLVMGQSSSAKGTGNKTADHFGNWDAWIVKLEDRDTTAAIEWQRSYGGLSGDLAYGAAQNPSGTYMVVGTSYSESDTVSGIGNKGSQLLGANDFWIMLLDADGSKLWDETFGGANIESCVKVLPGHGYGFVFGGHSSSGVNPPYKSEPSRGLNDMWVVRTGCTLKPPGWEDLPKVCRDETVQLDATVHPCNNCKYLWSDGATGPVRSVSPDMTTRYYVTLIHPDGCELEDSIRVEIVPGMDALVTDGVPISCYGADDAEFFIDGVIGGTPPYQFSLNGGAFEDIAYYVQLPPGNYTLDVLDDNGCHFDTAFNIPQPEQVLVELGDDLYIEIGDSVQLQALTNLVDSFTFQWGQPQLLSCNTCLVPWVRPFVTTTYSIHVQDKNGCEAKDLVRVILSKSDAVFIPNAFSPNLDNINDFFTVYADRSVVKVNSLLIFDRWGEKMFERYNFPPNVDQLGWDGHFGGKPMKPAVFVYWAEVEYVDGRKELFKGDVTLVR
jgi:gliding motility-associated-like protein